MTSWSFYRQEDGALLGVVFTGPESDLALNTPSGCRAVSGRFDHLSQRVNLATGQVEDWQAPPPQDTELHTHRWDAATKRWLASDTLAGRKLSARREVQAEIERIEAQQPRAMREAMLAGDSLAAAEHRRAATSRLGRIEALVQAQRQRLAEITAAPDEAALTALPKWERTNPI